MRGPPPRLVKKQLCGQAGEPQGGPVARFRAPRDPPKTQKSRTQLLVWQEQAQAAPTTRRRFWIAHWALASGLHNVIAGSTFLGAAQKHFHVLLLEIVDFVCLGGPGGSRDPQKSEGEAPHFGGLNLFRSHSAPWAAGAHTAQRAVQRMQVLVPKWLRLRSDPLKPTP